MPRTLEKQSVAEGPTISPLAGKAAPEELLIDPERLQRDYLVCVGIVPKGQSELIFQCNQPGHGIRTRTIHTDFAVVIDRHK